MNNHWFQNDRLKKREIKKQREFTKRTLSWSVQEGKLYCFQHWGLGRYAEQRCLVNLDLKFIGLVSIHILVLAVLSWVAWVTF